MFLESLWISTGSVAIAEMGDKTQLLAILLASRYQRPWPIIWGILAATLANHFVAALLGIWLRSLLASSIISWVLAASFIGAGIWALFPDRVGEKAAPLKNYGIFFTTFIVFFIAEIGDKTQVITTTLAAHFNALSGVVIGTTLGMMLANVPAVFLGNKITKMIPIHRMRYIAAGLFFLMGLLILLEVDFANLGLKAVVPPVS